MTLAFWTNEVSDGAAFALSAMVPALAASRLGLGAKAVSSLSELSAARNLLGAENAVLGATEINAAQRSLGAYSKTSKYLQNASKLAQFIDKSAVTVANTISESYFESKTNV